MTDPFIDANAKAGLEPGVIPYIVIERAEEACAFYEKALGATNIRKMPTEDGQRLIHAQIDINDGSVMLNDPFPENGHPAHPLHSLTMQLLVADAYAWFDRAVAAGCEPVMPVQVMFWGDHWGVVRDPFGVQWAFNQNGRPG